MIVVILVMFAKQVDIFGKKNYCMYTNQVHRHSYGTAEYAGRVCINVRKNDTDRQTDGHYAVALYFTLRICSAQLMANMTCGWSFKVTELEVVTYNTTEHFDTEMVSNRNDDC